MLLMNRSVNVILFLTVKKKLKGKMGDTKSEFKDENIIDLPMCNVLDKPLQLLDDNALSTLVIQAFEKGDFDISWCSKYEDSESDEEMDESIYDIIGKYCQKYCTT